MIALLELRSWMYLTQQPAVGSWNVQESHIMNIVILLQAALLSFVPNGSKNFAWSMITIRKILLRNGITAISCISLLILSGRLISITEVRMAIRKLQS